MFTAYTASTFSELLILAEVLAVIPAILFFQAIGFLWLPLLIVLIFCTRYLHGYRIRIDPDDRSISVSNCFAYFFETRFIETYDFLDLRECKVGIGPDADLLITLSFLDGPKYSFSGGCDSELRALRVALSGANFQVEDPGLHRRIAE